MHSPQRQTGHEKTRDWNYVYQLGSNLSLRFTPHAKGLLKHDRLLSLGTTFLSPIFDSSWPGKSGQLMMITFVASPTPFASPSRRFHGPDIWVAGVLCEMALHEVLHPGDPVCNQD